MVYASSYKFANAGMASLMTGLGLSSAVFCILTAQVWIYFRTYMRRPQENGLTKVLVVVIWLIQAAGMAITSRITSIHTMKFDDFSHFVDHLSMVWALYFGLSSLTTSLVHGYFIYRVYFLEKSIYGKRTISFILIALCVTEQAFGLLSTICIFKGGHYVNPVIVGVTLWSIPAFLGCSVIGDILIAGTLAHILHRNRTTSKRTNQMITKLIIFSFQTGLITTVTALIALGIWVVCSFTADHLYMCFPMGGLYATCLLANFIARESYLRPELQTINETELSKIACNPFPQEVPSLQSSSATVVELPSH